MAESTAPYREVVVSREGPVAVLIISRPGKMNAINRTMRAEFISRLGELNVDSGVRAIVLRGADAQGFSSGQDLEEAKEFTLETMVTWQTDQRALFQSVRDLDKPCVLAADGFCVGAGFQIALCADWRIATPKSTWGQPEVKVGLASITGAFLMELHIGRTHNTQLSLSGDLISGARAYEMGLVTELVEPNAIWSAAIERAAALGALPSNAIRLTKRRLRATSQAGFDDAFEAGIRAQFECYSNNEPQKMMREFFALRQRRSDAKRQA